MHSRGFVIALTEIVSQYCCSIHHHSDQHDTLVYVSLKVISVLNLISQHFTVQLIEAHAVTALLTSNILKSTMEAPVLATALTVTGQLARHSSIDSNLHGSEFQKDILQYNSIGSDLRELLQHDDGAVRSKCCSLIGNLCKASDWFMKVRLQCIINMCVLLYVTALNCYQHSLSQCRPVNLHVISAQVLQDNNAEHEGCISMILRLVHCLKDNDSTTVK
jgi:hypothetical protein